MQEKVYVEGVGVGQVLDKRAEGDVVGPSPTEARVAEAERDAGVAPRTPPWRTPAGRARKTHLRRRKAARQARKNNR